MKSIQFRGNTPAIEAFIGEDVVSLTRNTNGDAIVVGLSVVCPNGKLNINMNDWVVKDDGKYYVLNTESYILLSSKNDKLDGFKELFKSITKTVNNG